MDDNVTNARGHARAAWALFITERNLHARLTDWHTGTAPDGTPQVSARVHGPGAEHALRRFTTEAYLVLGAAGDQRQAFDYGVPDRTSCVWRTGGVWVELWLPKTPAVAPAAAPAVEPASAPVRAPRVLSGLGARFNFTRRRKETNPA